VKTLFKVKILVVALLAVINASARNLSEEQLEQIPTETIVQTHPLIECMKNQIKQNPPPVPMSYVYSISWEMCVNEGRELYGFCLAEISASARICTKLIGDVFDIASLEVLSSMTITEFRKNPDWRIQGHKLQVQDEQKRAIAKPGSQPLTTKKYDIQKKAADSLKIIKQKPEEGKQTTINSGAVITNDKETFGLQMTPEAMLEVQPYLRCMHEAFTQNPKSPVKDVFKICGDSGVAQLLGNYCVSKLSRSYDDCLLFLQRVGRVAYIEFLSGMSIDELKKDPDWKAKIDKLEAKDIQIRSAYQDNQEIKDPDWKAKIGLLFEKDLPVPNIGQDKQISVLADQDKNEKATYHSKPGSEADDSNQHHTIQQTSDNSKVQQENFGINEPSHEESAKQAETKVTLEVTPPDIKVGDFFIIESTNPAHPENNSKTERTVTSTEGDVIEVLVINLNNKSGKKRLLKFNKEWNLIATRNADNSGLDYSPPLKYFEFPLSPGKNWQQTSTETNIKTGTIRKHKISGVVGDWEDITVPAGTFHAIKVILNTEVVNPVTGEKNTGTDISWYAPDVKRSIKSEVTSRNEVDSTEQKSIAQLISFNAGSK